MQKMFYFIYKPITNYFMTFEHSYNSQQSAKVLLNILYAKLQDCQLSMEEVENINSSIKFLLALQDLY